MSWIKDFDYVGLLLYTAGLVLYVFTEQIF